MAEVATMPSLPSQAFDHTDASPRAVRRKKPKTGTVSTSGSKETAPRSGRGRSDRTEPTEPQQSSVLADSIRDLATKTKWTEFEPQASEWFLSATNDDERRYAAKRLHDGWERIFGRKRIPTELTDIGAYEESKVSQAFRDTGKSLLDTALSYKDIIRGYDKATGGAVQKTFARAVRNDPRMRALLSATSQASSAVESTTPSKSQQKRRRRKERNRGTTSADGTESLKGIGTGGPDTDTAPAGAGSANPAATEGEGTAPTKGEVTTTLSGDTKKERSKAARKAQLAGWKARQQEEDTQLAVKRKSPTSKAISFAPHTSQAASGETATHATTGAGTADTRGTDATTADTAETRERRGAHFPKVQGATAGLTGTKPDTAEATQAQTSTGGFDAKAIADRFNARNAAKKQAKFTSDTSQLQSDLKDPTKFQSAVDALGSGMTAAARKSLGDTKFDAIRPVDPEVWSAVTKNLGTQHEAQMKRKHDTRMALNKTIETKAWTATADGYTRTDTIAVREGDKVYGEGTLRHVIHGGKKEIIFSYAYPDTDAANSEFAFAGPATTLTRAGSNRSVSTAGPSDRTTRDRLTSLNTAPPRTSVTTGTKETTSKKPSSTLGTAGTQTDPSSAKGARRKTQLPSTQRKSTLSSLPRTSATRRATTSA